MKECLINMFLDLDGLGEGGDDAAVGTDFVGGKAFVAVSAVLKPLMAHLVAADPVLPYLGWNALEILGLVDVDAFALRVVAQAFLSGPDLAIPFTLEFGDGRVELWGS